MKNKEIWKTIDEFQDYEISSHGRVYSHHRNKLKKLVPDKDGYNTAILHDKRRFKNCKVHRLVAQAFIPNPNNLPQVNHKDEIKDNNYVDNLEWCTNKYNLNYSDTAKSKRTLVGKYNSNGDLIKAYNSMTAVNEDGYDQAHVSKVCNGIRPHHKGYIWRFLDE